jgi:uncharacterized protein (DUF983 family)
MTKDQQQSKMLLDEVARRKALAQSERNFCPQCGRRLSGGFVKLSIHTCTPPKEKT